MTYPVRFQWDGEVMVCKQPGLADRQYVVGETYHLIPHEPRSRATHNHFFACVHEAWLNIPLTMADRFPTEEHLRKWALIQAGYFDERSIACSSKAEAVRIAAFVKPMDDFAIVVARESTVVVLTAKSQSMKAMGKKVFAESKAAVLDKLAELVGVSTEALTRNAGRAA
jgi:hypothetical protein